MMSPNEFVEWFDKFFLEYHCPEAITIQVKRLKEYLKFQTDVNIQKSLETSLINKMHELEAKIDALTPDKTSAERLPIQDLQDKAMAMANNHRLTMTIEKQDLLEAKLAEIEKRLNGQFDFIMRTDGAIIARDEKVEILEKDLASTKYYVRNLEEKFCNYINATRNELHRLNEALDRAKKLFQLAK